MKPVAPSIAKRKRGEARVLRFRASEYALIPRRLTLRPPIRHKGGKSGLSPFEFAVMAGILVAARVVLDDQRRAQAHKAGKRAMALQRKYYDEYECAWQAVKQARRHGERIRAGDRIPAPKLRTAFDAQRYYDDENMKLGVDRHRPQRPLQRGRMMKLAGRDTYKKALKQSGQLPLPTSIAVSISGPALLRLAHLSKSGPQVSRLAAAFDRLCQHPLDGDDPGSEALLLDWRTQGSAFRLQVNGQWLLPPYHKVRLPLPLASATALAFYLFADAVCAHSYRNPSIDYHKLCGLLGIANRGRADADRNFDRALAILNAHLDLHQMGRRYDIVPVADGVRIRMWDVERYDDDYDVDDDSDEQSMADAELDDDADAADNDENVAA